MYQTTWTKFGSFFGQKLFPFKLYYIYIQLIMVVKCKITILLMQQDNATERTTRTLSLRSKFKGKIIFKKFEWEKHIN